jgi:hypothetical protein
MYVHARVTPVLRLILSLLRVLTGNTYGGYEHIEEG